MSESTFTHSRYDRTLVVSVIEYFGKETIRPENELARNFAELLGQKTLTRRDIEKIKSLGYEVKQKEIPL